MPSGKLWLLSASVGRGTALLAGVETAARDVSCTAGLALSVLASMLLDSEL
jgi:hypothetical protein